MNTDAFFDALWSSYVAVTPQAGRIKAAFEQRGEKVLNDHVAFRTLALSPIGLAKLEPYLLNLGYKRYEPYEFPAKKLKAYGYLPPQPQQPRVFLSELMVDQLSPPVQAVLERCAAQVDPALVERPEVLWSGRLWDPISWAEYELLAAESEYAAWLACLGIVPNHFTISVNALQQHPEVEDVLRVVEELGYQVNDSGGRVKGSPEVLLEQGSTLADRLPQTFSDGVQRVAPTCYYEFAKRYPKPDGSLFQGFVAASADKIFESTDAKGGAS